MKLSSKVWLSSLFLRERERKGGEQEMEKVEALICIFAPF